MDDLALTGGSAAFIDGFPPCSAGLRKLLTEGESYLSIRLISINPTLRAECERVVVTLAKAVAGAGPAEAERVVGLAALDYEITGDQELFTPYGILLSTYSADSIRDALRLWKSGHGMREGMNAFFPRPEQLVPLAEISRVMWSGALHRARKAIEKYAADTPRAKSPQDMHQIRRMLEEFRASPKHIPEPKRPRETPQQVAERLRSRAVTPTGQSGLSPLMRKRMGLPDESILDTPACDDPGLVI